MQQSTILPSLFPEVLTQDMGGGCRGSPEGQHLDVVALQLPCKPWEWQQEKKPWGGAHGAFLLLGERPSPLQ